MYGVLYVQKGRAMARKPKKKTAALKKALRDLSPEDIRRGGVKSERIEIRATPKVKAEMEKAAASFGLTVTEYLTELHDIAAERLKGRRGKRR